MITRGHIVRFLGAACGLLLFAGCMSVSVPSASDTPWTPPERAVQDDAAWRRIRAQVPDLSESLALSDLVDVALYNNPATANAWYDARAAAAQVEQARGYFLPTLVGKADGMRQGVAADPDDFDSDRLNYGPGLKLNYLVLNFGGGRAAAVEQALQTVYAKNYTFNRAIQDVLLAVETAYYGLVGAEAGVEAAEAGVADAQLTLDTVQARRSAGLGTELEVLQAQSGYDQSRFNLADAKGRLQIARGSLAQALGWPADTKIDIVAPETEIPANLPPQDMRRMLDDAIKRRPDVAALRATLAAQQAAIKVAGSTLWPSLYLNADVNRWFYENYQGKEYQDRDWTYSAGFSLQWTFFDGLQTVNARRAAAAKMESVRAQLAQAELAAGADVWKAYANYQSALEKNHYSEAYLKSASANYDLALDSYRNGLNAMLDVVNAESQLSQARSQNVSARQEAFVALAKLAYAAGLLDREGGAGEIFANNAREEHQ